MFQVYRQVSTLGVVLLLAIGLMIPVQAQEFEPAPTLVPPTPVPAQVVDTSDALITESALARIESNGEVRIGILYNQPPFGELNIRGEVVGYDAVLGRSIAETWGVEPVFVQVTRQTAYDMLLDGDVDLLLAAQVHRREADERVEFSQTYYRGSQAMMVRLDDPAASLQDMANRRIGVVLATPAEGAVNNWRTRNNVNVAIQTYWTIDLALAALAASEVDGVVDKRYVLRDLVRPEALRVLDDVVEPEPYAIAMRRQDVNFRNLVNHTLQYLATTGRMAEIHNEYFPSRFPVDTIPIWEGVGESAPQPSQYANDVPYPQEFAVPRVRSNSVLRVAGIPQSLTGLPEADRRVAQANTQLAEAIAARWGVQVEFVPNSENDPIGYVERGEADIALGLRPDWGQVNRVDFTATYLLRGKRLLTTVQDDVTSLAELRGKWVGVFATEPGTAEFVVDLGVTVNANLRTYTVNSESDVAAEMLENNNVDAMFGDSIRLLPHLEANSGILKLSDRCSNCDPWYTREYYGMAVPRNDVEFRLLVEYTLQELYLDGTLTTVLRPVSVPGQEVSLAVWPGSSDYLGFRLR
jgi:polar amino acid transport system substrate-binding protein